MSAANIDVITESALWDALPDADEWAKVKDKLKYLER